MAIPTAVCCGTCVPTPVETRTVGADVYALPVVLNAIVDASRLVPAIPILAAAILTGGADILTDGTLV